jgi:outer membrane protein assembly factor BamB
MDERGGNFEFSPRLQAVTAAIPVGRFIDPDFRVYVGTIDGHIAVFRGANRLNQPQLFQVTDQPVLWSLYHAARTLYLGTGDVSSSGRLLALDDQSLGLRWEVFFDGGILYPAGVAYQGNTPKAVVATGGAPNPSVRAFDPPSGIELWRVPDFAFGQRVHDGVVYYGNINDSTLCARDAITGVLLWSFRNPRDFNFQVPIVAGGVVWASTVGNQVFALNAANGSLMWEVELGGHPGAPIVYFNHDIRLSVVAVAEQDGVSPGFLQGIDANTGVRLWTSNVPVTQAGESCSDLILAAPAGSEAAQIQMGNFDGRLLSFNAQTGELQWERDLTPGEAIFARPHWESYA